ncbi:MAG TPA: hypothetical protein PLM16_01015 [Candidatus Woesebacteria bacterium]|nr:hypothetical protein [Candidatus Woesebacteria bacterium]
MKTPENKSEKPEVFESLKKKLSQSWLKFIVALIMNPSNYFMTPDVRKSLLGKYGYTLNDEGKLQSLDNET